MFHIYQEAPLRNIKVMTMCSDSTEGFHQISCTQTYRVNEKIPLSPFKNSVTLAIFKQSTSSDVGSSCYFGTKFRRECNSCPSKNNLLYLAENIPSRAGVCVGLLPAASVSSAPPRTGAAHAVIPEIIHQ